MAQFNSELMINNCNIYQMYGYKSVLITGSEERVFGADRSISVESKNNGLPTSFTITKNRQSIKIELIKIDTETKKLKPISANDLRDLSRLMFKNKICMLQERNIVYFGFFTNGTNYFNTANQGYITLTFELVSPYCYSPIQTEHFWIVTKKEFALRNVATADEMVYPRVKIIGEKNGDVKIKNLTNNNTITIKAVKENEEIVLDGETREIFSLTNKSENMFSRLEYTKDFLYLEYAENHIVVEGNCQIEFQYQCPMLIV